MRLLIPDHTSGGVISLETLDRNGIVIFFHTDVGFVIRSGVLRRAALVSSLTLPIDLITGRLAQHLQRQIVCVARAGPATINPVEMVLFLAVPTTIQLEELRMEGLAEREVLCHRLWEIARLITQSAKSVEIFYP